MTNQKVNSKINQLVAFMRLMGRSKAVTIAGPLFRFVIPRDQVAEGDKEAETAANVKFWRCLEDIADGQAALVGQFVYEVCAPDRDYQFRRVPPPDLITAIRVTDFLIAEAKGRGMTNATYEALVEVRAQMAAKLVNDVVYKSRTYKRRTASVKSEAQS